MEIKTSKRSNKYSRVMPRVYKQSTNTLKSKTCVTRHELPSSTTVGAKSVSNPTVNSSVFSELPTVLHDYTPEVPAKRKYLMRPRKTIRSLDPSLSPHRNVSVSRPKVHNIEAANSAPIISNTNGEKWSETHYRNCYSSRSHSRLKELQDEIKAFRENDKKMKLRSRLYETCGVILNDAGAVLTDKAVQVEAPTAVACLKCTGEPLS